MATKKERMRDKIYSRSSFNVSSMREGLSSQYFALANLDQEDATMPFLQEMKDNHEKCPYWILVKRYCPCTVDIATKRKINPRKLTFPKPPLKTLLADHLKIGSVHSFVCSVLKRIIPMEFFGHISNRRNFLKNLKGLLSVQKYGTISLDYLIREIKVSKMSWLFKQNLSLNEKMECLLKCVDFLVSKVICPLIQSFFFFVDSSYAKINLFIFRKRVWHRLSHKAFADFKKFTRLNYISQQRYNNLLQLKECLGCAKIDFILKKSCLRPISNLSFQEDGRVSINSRLKSLLVVLNYEKEANKPCFGATAMGKSDFHKKFREYIMKVKAGKLQKLYFVTADIEKCFDSIQPSLLLDISRKLIRSNCYIVYKYKRPNPKMKQAFLYFESVQYLTDIQHRYGNVELIGQRAVEKKKVIETLEALLLCNVVKMGKRYYLQKRGISQGSKVSSVLCAAYLSHIESKISTALGINDFFVRMEDEYLFISDMERSAKCFLKDMIEGLPKFECHININKCATSFDCALGGDIGEITKCVDIKFYGLSLHSTNFTVSADYSHYKGLKASDVVTCRLTRHPGRTLEDCVVRSLFHKCDAILFDETINTQDVMEKSVLKIFCMTAAKFHFLVMRLPKQNRVEKNPNFFLNIIMRLPGLLYCHICYALNKLDFVNGINSTCPVQIEKIRGLCYSAFLFKLTKSINIYRKIIDSLRRQVSLYPTVRDGLVKEAFKNIFLR